MSEKINSEKQSVKLFSGKFKDVAALEHAYGELEREFTRRSQRLREAEEELRRIGVETDAGIRGCFADGGTAASDVIKAADAELPEVKSERNVQTASEDVRNAGEDWAELPEVKSERSVQSDSEDVGNAGEDGAGLPEIKSERSVQPDSEYVEIVGKDGDSGGSINIPANEFSPQKSEAISDERNVGTNMPEPLYKAAEWKTRAEEFFSEYPAAAPYAKEIARMLLDDPALASRENCLEAACLRVLGEKPLTAEQIASSPGFIMKAAIAREEVRDRILSDYITGINGARPPVVMSSGGGQALTPPFRPKTFEEAGKLFLDGVRKRQTN